MSESGGIGDRQLCFVTFHFGILEKVLFLVVTLDLTYLDSTLRSRRLQSSTQEPNLFRHGAGGGGGSSRELVQASFKARDLGASVVWSTLGLPKACTGATLVLSPHTSTCATRCYS